MKNYLFFCLIILLSSLSNCKKPDDIPPLISEDEPGEYSILHDGIIRTMMLHVPDTYDGSEAYPLLIGLHGSGSSGEEFQGLGFDSRADKFGFIVVYPDGHNHSWNIGDQSDTRSLGIDDVGFISTLIQSLTSQYRIDLSRVYVTGHSLGAFMTYRLASEIPEKIAAIAPVAGLNITFTQQQASTPMPVMHLHAKNDPTVSYYGTPPYVLSVDELLASWRQINDCSEDGVELFNESGIIGTLWASPGTGNDVILYAYEEGGHAWLPYSTDLICEFFYNHPKRSNNIRIAAPVMGTIYAISAPVEITIDTEQAGNINRVEFYANDIQIGEDNEAPFSLTWTNEEIGEYSLKLIAYTDNGETIISSNSVTIWKCLPSIALNKICISSSDENSSLTPEYATDNDFLTRWSSEWSDPQWIYVDLGDIYTVNGVTLVWEPAYGTHYQIQTSTSATDWTEVYSTTNGQGKTEYIPFSATDAQYVRMYGTQRATRWGYSLWEFQVHTE